MKITTRRVLPIFLAQASAIVATACLLGWLSGIGILTSLFDGLPTMVPLTALLTLLSSWALQLRHEGSRPETGRWQALLLVAAASLILLAYAAQHLGMLPGAPIARMGLRGVSSPLTAAMFLGIGISLLTLPSARFVTHSQWVALAVLFLALLTLASYLLRDTFLYRLLPGTGTSVLTASVMVLLSAACLWTRPSEGIMAAMTGDTPGTKIARRLLLSAAVTPILIGLLVFVVLRFGLLDVDTAIALLVWSIVAFLVVSTWHGAVRLNQAEDALEDALAALRQADANKDRFLAVLAHELRNPLAPLRAAADLLRLGGGLDAARQRRTGEIVARQIDTMSHLIEDLLDLARIGQGVIHIDHAPVDLHAVVSDAVEQTRPLMAERRHRLQAHMPDTHPQLAGDHKRLVQVVVNLLVNAAKYTPDGGEIVLSLLLGAGRARIVVQDSGIGIDRELLERVFESFTQAARDGDRGKGGLGLGLALVKSLVELHGGTVSAESEGIGKGSTFTVHLPCQRGC